MSIGSTLARAQRAAEALMVDACSVKYADGSSFNESTGREEPTYVVRFSSRCKIQSRDLDSVERDAGGHESTAIRVTLHLPVSAGLVAVDDVVTVTACVFDPQLVGRSFRVLAPVGKSFASARRVEVEGIVA